MFHKFLKNDRLSASKSQSRHSPAGRLATLFLVIALVTMTTACAPSATTPGQATNAPFTPTSPVTTAAKPFQYVTSVYPLYLAAANIAKGVPGVRVSNLTEEITGCLHDYQLTTGNMKTLEQADVFIVNGADLEGYLDTIARDLPGLQLIEAAEGIELHEDNPHVWVSISLMIRQVETLTREMSRLDPKNQTAYENNAKAYIDRLSNLRQKMHESIEALPNRQIITVHEAFPYFASEFNLEIAGVIEREPDSEPSAAELAATIDLIRDKKVRAVFAEPQYPIAAAQQIAEESGARLFTLDPVASGDLGNLDAYLDAMEKNRQVLVEALG